MIVKSKNVREQSAGSKRGEPNKLTCTKRRKYRRKPESVENQTASIAEIRTPVKPYPN